MAAAYGRSALSSTREPKFTSAATPPASTNRSGAGSLRFESAGAFVIDRLFETVGEGAVRMCLVRTGVAAAQEHEIAHVAPVAARVVAAMPGIDAIFDGVAGQHVQ